MLLSSSERYNRSRSHNNDKDTVTTSISEIGIVLEEYDDVGSDNNDDHQHNDNGVDVRLRVNSYHNSTNNNATAVGGGTSLRRSREGLGRGGRGGRADISTRTNRTIRYGGNGSTIIMIRILFVLLSFLTIWYNTRNSIASTLSFIALDYQNQNQRAATLAAGAGATDITAEIGQGCSDSSNETNSKRRSRQERRQHLPLTSQTYVISFHHKKVTETFHQRNSQTGFYATHTNSRNTENDENNDENENEDEVRWFPAVNGYDPKVLEEWTQTAHRDFPIITPEMGREGYPMPNNKNDKNNYLSPHVIGCYESHRRLLTVISQSWKKVKHQSSSSHSSQQHHDNNNDDDEHNNSDEYNNDEYNDAVPDALFVFEDDTLCVDDTKQQIMELIPQLPKSWDILMIGGKPFSYLESKDRNDKVFQSIEEKEQFHQEIEKCNGETHCQIFRKYACAGKFGTSSTGPFGGGGLLVGNSNGTTTTTNDVDVDIELNNLALSRKSLRSDHPTTNQPYWKMNYVTDTHAYVINPKHIHKVLQLSNDMVHIHNPLDNFRPIDITFADSMNSKNNKQGVQALQAYLPSKGEYCKQVSDTYEHDLQQEQTQTERKLQRQEEEEEEEEEEESLLRLRKSIATGNSTVSTTTNTNKEKKQHSIDQYQHLKTKTKTQPKPWQGYYHHNSIQGVIWEELYFHDCPESYRNGLL